MGNKLSVRAENFMAAQQNLQNFQHKNVLSDG
jgi:hypothetical protein